MNPIKQALRLFRNKLSIPLVELELKPQVIQYLNYHRLIAFNDYQKTYEITPRGFNWDVDLVMVRMPELDEDIMKRDEDIEITNNA